MRRRMKKGSPKSRQQQVARRRRQHPASPTIASDPKKHQPKCLYRSLKSCHHPRLRLRPRSPSQLLQRKPSGALQTRLRSYRPTLQPARWLISRERSSLMRALQLRCRSRRMSIPSCVYRARVRVPRGCPRLSALQAAQCLTEILKHRQARSRPQRVSARTPVQCSVGYCMNTTARRLDARVTVRRACVCCTPSNVCVSPHADSVLEHTSTYAQWSMPLLVRQQSESRRETRGDSPRGIVRGIGHCGAGHACVWRDANDPGEAVGAARGDCTHSPF